MLETKVGTEVVTKSGQRKHGTFRVQNVFFPALKALGTKVGEKIGTEVGTTRKYEKVNSGQLGKKLAHLLKIYLTYIVVCFVMALPFPDLLK